VFFYRPYSITGDQIVQYKMLKTIKLIEKRVLSSKKEKKDDQMG
jgi:hypothetical protein